MIDLHISCLKKYDENTLKAIISSSKLPVLALNYNQTYDFKPADFSEEERVKSLLMAVDCGAAGIEMQGYTFHLPSKDNFCGENKYAFTTGNPKEIVTDKGVIDKQCELIEDVHRRGGEVFLSCRVGVPMNSSQVVELALFLEERKPDIIEIVTIANNEEEMIESIRAMALLKKAVKTKVGCHAEGIAGSPSRIINPILGSQIIFCLDRHSENSTMEQLDLTTVRKIIRK
jgi:hypothetical protein